jgi:hypothetical protein
MLETDLYEPIKTLLKNQGYDVKSEISNCDVVAVRGDEDPVIVELKLSFNLNLVFQGIRRQTISELVYLAVDNSGNRGWSKRYKDIIKLCRMLGLGLISVSFKSKKGPVVEIHLDPAPYQPRPNKKRKGRLLKEFQKRAGDPNKGGSTKTKLMTAYRQDALRCARFLNQNGPTKAAFVSTETGVAKATVMMRTNHYGWFDKAERGIYQLSPGGADALIFYAPDLAILD